MPRKRDQASWSPVLVDVREENEDEINKIRVGADPGDSRRDALGEAVEADRSRRRLVLQDRARRSAEALLIADKRRYGDAVTSVAVAAGSGIHLLQPSDPGAASRPDRTRPPSAAAAAATVALEGSLDAQLDGPVLANRRRDHLFSPRGIVGATILARPLLCGARRACEEIHLGTMM